MHIVRPVADRDPAAAAAHLARRRSRRVRRAPRRSGGDGGCRRTARSRRERREVRPLRRLLGRRRVRPLVRREPRGRVPRLRRRDAVTARSSARPACGDRLAAGPLGLGPRLRDGGGAGGTRRRLRALRPDRGARLHGARQRAVAGGDDPARPSARPGARLLDARRPADLARPHLGRNERRNEDATDPRERTE